MNKQAITWLYKELPDLAAKGVISPETAEKIKNHYGAIEDNQGSRTFLMVFGVIGVLLIGLGIILLIAHNWEQLSRISRLMLSVSLLLAAQLTAGTVLYLKPNSKVWRESAATLHMIMIGAAIALVGQTYHLTEDTDMFLLTWLLLSLPLLYLMTSSSVATLYIMGVTLWATNNSHFGLESQLVWALLGLALPYYWKVIRQERTANTTSILAWIFNICFYFCFTTAFSHYIDHFGFLIYSALFTINYLIGLLWFNAADEKWRIPFKIIGLAGSTVIIFMLTFNSFWNDLRLASQNINKPEIFLAVLLVAVTIIGILMVTRKLGRQLLPFAVAPVIIGAAHLFQSFDASGITATLIMNIYMFILSIFVISTGTRNNSIGTVNIGMVMLAVLIVARFLDINFSFVVRGLVFVLLGIGFLVTNWIMVRRKAREQK
ncbi:hypothetical protein SDC9_20832 [bioreactor metagenome]|uniref:DUF2157 domain-containing protein n=1 Tax=bioreactor metagenome TaxID=1076179 RepID=A0A644U804_9ZZZZ|nr:DUF2157 domain-containing protein [Negativicutes bacterium]